MALTQKKLQALRGKSLLELFDQHRNPWLEKAQSAYQYVDHNLPAGERPRIDDVALVLAPVLGVDRVLVEYLQSKKLIQNYWVTYFCDYVLEQFWAERRPQERGGRSRGG